MSVHGNDDRPARPGASIEGHVALVTGAGWGLGRRIRPLTFQLMHDGGSAPIRCLRFYPDAMNASGSG